MEQKRIERQALLIGIIVNVIMVIAGFIVFFMTGLKAMFLDASFTVISVISGGVAAYLSNKTVRTSERFPNGMFALEPIYAIAKAIFTLALLLFAFIDSLQVAINYFAFDIGEPMEFRPVVIYQIGSVIICLLLVGYYRARNRSINNASTMLRAEANGTWIDGIISLGIGVISVLLFFLPFGTPLDFLHYTGDFFITALIVAITIREPIIVLRDAFVELVGGVHNDAEISQFVESEVRANMPAQTSLQNVHVFKTGMNFDVDIFIEGTSDSVNIADLVRARNAIERSLEERLHIVNVDFVFE